MPILGPEAGVQLCGTVLHLALSTHSTRSSETRSYGYKGSPLPVQMTELG